MQSSNNNDGTPKSLDQTIEFTLCFPGTMAEVKSRMHANLRDFLAQRFNVAMLQAKSPEQEKSFEDLFKEIVK